MKELEDSLGDWMEGICQYGRVDERTEVGTQGDNPCISMSREQREEKRLKWQVLIKSRDVHQQLGEGWASDVNTSGMEQELLQSASPPSWPQYVRRQRNLHGGRDVFIFFTQCGSGNGLHKDPAGGLAHMAVGWKVFVWWDAADTSHVLNPKQPERGISLLRAAEPLVPSLRWTLLAPGDTLFIHPDQCHIVLSLSTSILITQNRTFFPFRLFRSIGIVLTGKLRDNAWVEETGANHINTYPELCVFVVWCMRRAVKRWQKAGNQGRLRVQQLIEAWEEQGEMVKGTFTVRNEDVVLQPCPGGKLSKDATLTVHSALADMEDVVFWLKESWQHPLPKQRSDSEGGPGAPPPEKKRKK